MNIYISTGGFSKNLPTKTITKFNEKKILDIELSGGKYSRNIINKILKIKKKK